MHRTHPGRRTLTEEHALLLDHVAARVDDVATAAAADRWPRQELQALLDFVHAKVLRQLADEEQLLTPGHPTPSGFARLRRDHVRLRHCAEALATAASGESGWGVARVATTSRDLLTMLQRHLAAEEALFTTGHTSRPVPATAVLTGHPYEW